MRTRQSPTDRSRSLAKSARIPYGSSPALAELAGKGKGGGNIASPHMWGLGMKMMLLLPLFRIGQLQLQDISSLSLSCPPTNTREKMRRCHLGSAGHEMLLSSGAPLAGSLPRP